MSRYSIIKGSRLPSEFQEVEYIESTGTQWIDTCKKLGTNNSIIADVQFNNTNRQVLISGGSEIIPIAIENSNNSFWISGGDFYPELQSATTNRVKLEYDFYHKLVKINDIKVYDMIYTQSKTANIDSAIFANRFSHSSFDRYCSCKLFGLTVKDTDVIVNNLVPCYRKADNVIGMYDLISGVFYTNAGIGVFTKGNDTSVNLKQKLSKYAIIKGARLPSEFQEVEYLEGGLGQYIQNIWDIGDHTIEFDIMPVDMSGGFNNWLFGLYDTRGIGLEASTYGITISRENLTQVYAGTVTPTIAVEGVRKQYTFVTRPGVYSTNKLGLFFETGYPNRTFNGRVYSFKVKRTSDNELIRDLVMCYRKADNITGVYDLVTGVFFPRAYEEFTLGSEVGINIKQKVNRYAIVKGSRLPSEYQEVEYVESSNLNSYIQTQHIISGGDKFVIDFQLTEISSGDHYLIGVFDTTRTEFGTYSNNWYAFNCIYSPLEPLDTERHKFTITYTGTFTNTNPTKIIARNGVLAKIYSADIYDSNNILLNNFIPCYRKSDNAIGLYDLVGGVFYIGTNTFTKGNNVSRYIAQKI